MPRKCTFGGTKLGEMLFANFRISELPAQEPERCEWCEAIRTPRFVMRSLGHRNSGCWQWDLIYPYHEEVTTAR